MDKTDLTVEERKASYEQTKDYVLEQKGDKLEMLQASAQVTDGCHAWQTGEIQISMSEEHQIVLNY